MIEVQPSATSFRDPSGFIFRHEGCLYRLVQTSYQPHFDHLMASGLYEDLVHDGLLIPHEECPEEFGTPGSAYKVLRPTPVPFISYPYEWCFSAWRDAALCTLEIQRRALRFGMSLKDASAFNIQFHEGRPIFLDTLSFELYDQGRPWAAYRQFCRHFLAPLALMSTRDVRLGSLFRSDLEGVPLDLASRLLPWRSRWKPSLLMHIHLHARFETRLGSATTPPPSGRFSLRSMLGLVESLRGAIEGMKWSGGQTEWVDYEQQHGYAEPAAACKERLVGEFLDLAGPETVWDLGSNTGRFSRLSSAPGRHVVALDADPACVESLYLDGKRREETRIVPLVMDLANPTPALGWQHQERLSLLERGPADLVLALALVHHLAIGSNLPLRQVAEFLARAGRSLVIEFVPKHDPQVSRLLVVRPDIFPDYHQAGFEQAFREFFTIVRAEPLPGSERWLYLMQRNSSP